jgi:nanoRNase/pAp phosphatase (c-di-AMP/oligoRNAs hydrolase)
MSTIAVTHKNMDFDALASLTAAVLLVPDARPLLPKTINPNVKAFLSLHKDVFPWMGAAKGSLDEVKRLVVVDTAAWERLQDVNVLKQRDDLDILIWDHHPQPPTINASWICQESVGANITLMLRNIVSQAIELSPIQATLFLAGLYEDTGQLLFPSTTAEDARAAAFLLDAGGDLNIISRFLRPAYGEKQKNVLFEMLKSARREKVNGHSISISRLPIDGHVHSLALVVGMYREIMNVDAAFGIFCLNDSQKCMVIGRSDTDDLNMGDIMRSIGGGGHPGAGSAMLREVNPEAVAEMISELVAGNKIASVQISDLMSFPVHSVHGNATMAEVARVLREKGYTGLPVLEDNTLAGIISRRDFVKLRRESQMKKPVKAYMRREVMTIEAGKSPQQAARLMVRYDIGRLPVMENNRVVGIVTRSDVMHYFYDMLPN